MTFTTNGKEVLRDGRHFADTESPEDAEAIATVLGHDMRTSAVYVEASTDIRASIAAYLDRESRNKGRSHYFRRLLSVLADNVRSRLDVVEVTPEGERARYHEEAQS